jgi:hypothetical protein
MKDHAVNFRLGNELLNGLRAIRERDHISVSCQIRLAVEQWLTQRGLRGFGQASQRGPRRAPEHR